MNFIRRICPCLRQILCMDIMSNVIEVLNMANIEINNTILCTIAQTMLRRRLLVATMLLYIRIKNKNIINIIKENIGYPIF